MQAINRMALAIIFSFAAGVSICAQETAYVPAPFDVGVNGELFNNFAPVYVPPPLGTGANEPVVYVPPPLGFGSNSYSAETYVPPPLTAVGLMADQNFNSGTIYAACPITFGSAVIQSLGQASMAANLFPNHYDGANLTFIGAVHLFNYNTLDQRITVNNTTTFAGGWTVSGGTTSPWVVINGSPSGVLVVGTIDLDRPLSIQTVTVDLNGFVTAGGVTSSTAVGLISNDEPVAANLYDAWPSAATVNLSTGVSTDELIRYTYYGDANLAGIATLSGWSNSDATEWLPGHVEMVPEPSTAILSVGGAAILLLMRRRRLAGSEPSRG